MSQADPKSNSKTSMAVVAGVGAAAGAAAIQSANAKVSTDAFAPPVDSPLVQAPATLNGENVQVPVEFVDAGQVEVAVGASPVTNIEQLVDAYLADDLVPQLDAEALAETDIQEQMLDAADALQAMASQDGAQVAQAGGDTSGILGDRGTGSDAGDLALLALGAAGGYFAVDKLLEDDDGPVGSV